MRVVTKRLPKLRTLRVGAPGDAAIMEAAEGLVSFVDTRNNTRNGTVHLRLRHAFATWTGPGPPSERKKFTWL